MVASITTTPVQQSSTALANTAANQLLFGNANPPPTTTDSVKDTIPYPDIDLPAFTQKDMEAADQEFFANFTKAKKQQTNLTLRLIQELGQVANSLLTRRRMKRKVKKAEKKGQKYLPTSIRKRVTGYNRFRYWVDRLFGKKGEADRKLATLIGPLEIKLCQAKVMSATESLSTKQLSAALTSNVPIIGAIIEKQIKKDEKVIHKYGDLLDSVTFLDKSFFKKELDQLQKAFNTETGHHLTVGKAIGAGSIGQVFEGNIKETGEKVVVKVRRPDATPNLIDEFLPYLYYQNLCLKGVNNKREAYEDAVSNIATLKEEIDLQREQPMAEALAAWKKANGMDSFAIPTFHVATDDGFVQSYAGDQSLNQLKKAGDSARFNQTLINIAPDFIRLYATCPKKYLDYHMGNILITPNNETPTLIDYGRMKLLNEDAHQGLAKVLVSALKQKNVMGALESPNAYGLDLSPITTGDPAAIQTYLKGLFNLSGQSAQSSKQRRPKYKNAFTPTLLNTWVNYSNLQITHKGLKPLTKQPIAEEDRKNIRSKFMPLLQQYWLLESPQELAKEQSSIQQLTPAEFKQIFQLHTWQEKTTAPNFYPDDSPLGKLFDEGLKNALNKDRFQALLTSVLADSTDAKNLQLAYRGYNRLHKVSQQLTNDWLTLSEETLSDKEKVRLHQHIKYGLAQEMNVESNLDQATQTKKP